MQKERRFLERIVDEMDLTGEPIPGQSIVEIAGDSRVLIENHCGITQYDAEKFCVKVRFGHIAVCGCNLELSQMTRDRLVISGKIGGITIHRRRSK